ncbi:MAG: hypothetical protein ACLFP0_12170, partial [Rhodosalinus sp.]
MIVAEAQERRGARLSIRGLQDGRLAHRAAPLHRHPLPPARAGAGDLDGHGLAGIARVDRPHPAKTLRVWRHLPDPRRLEPVADLRGVTNHRIGKTDISGGLRDCGAGPEIVVADADWRRLLAVMREPGRLTDRDIGAHKVRAGLAAALASPGTDPTACARSFLLPEIPRGESGAAGRGAAPPSRPVSRRGGRPGRASRCRR